LVFADTVIQFPRDVCICICTPKSNEEWGNEVDNLHDDMMEMMRYYCCCCCLRLRRPALRQTKTSASASDR